MPIVLTPGHDRFSLSQSSKDVEVMFARLRELFLGRDDAVDFVRNLAFIVDVWDDLVDRDVSVAPAAVSHAFTLAIVGFNTNSFFRQNVDKLLPVLMTGILNWHGANELEAHGTLHALQVAHVTRCSIGDVAVLAAGLIGGMEHGARCAAEIRMLMQQDSLEDYLADFGVQQC